MNEDDSDEEGEKEMEKKALPPLELLALIGRGPRSLKKMAGEYYDVRSVMSMFLCCCRPLELVPVINLAVHDLKPLMKLMKLLFGWSPIVPLAWAHHRVRHVSPAHRPGPAQSHDAPARLGGPEGIWGAEI